MSIAMSTAIAIRSLGFELPMLIQQEYLSSGCKLIAKAMRDGFTKYFLFERAAKHFANIVVVASGTSRYLDFN